MIAFGGVFISSVSSCLLAKYVFKCGDKAHSPWDVNKKFYQKRNDDFE